MKKMKLILFTILTSILLIGCNSSSPEERAIDFALALSVADIEKANELSSIEIQKKIKKMQLVCAKPVAKKLFDESVSILDTISTKSNEKEYQKKLDEIFTKFKKDFDSTKKTVKDEVIKKYGSLKNIPASEKKSLQEDAKVEVMLLAQPMIDDIFEVLDLKSSNSSEVKKVLSKYAMDQNRLKYTYRNNSRLLVLVVEEVLKENLPDITLQCIAEHTDFHNIDDINVIELRQKSPDKAKVRLEIIYENTKSKKVSIKVEKIKDQWKVTRGSSIKGIY